jgi:hypothetical protein
MTAIRGTPSCAATEGIQAVPHIAERLVSFFTQIYTPDVLLGLLFVTNFDIEATLIVCLLVSLCRASV